MKKLFLSLILACGFCYGQAPQKINYQGLVRDALGTPVTTLSTVGIEFKISDGASNLVHSEVQNAVPVNTLGLFNTKIGQTTPISNGITWQNGPYTLSVSINTGSGFTFLGSQELVSVPFALYAQKAGNSLPLGTRNGQTLRWDSIPNAWIVDNNLTNDGSHVGIGLYPAGLRSRLHVTTNAGADTTVIFGFHPNIQAKGAGIRGMVIGSTPGVAPGSDPFPTAIFGGNHTSINQGTGLAAGNYGLGSSQGFGVGLMGIGLSTSPTSTAAGLYASAIGVPGSTKLAAVFDEGSVFFNDSIFIAGTNTVGAMPGNVLTLSSSGRAKWAPAGSGSSPWLQNTGFVHLLNNNDLVGIGTGTNMPVAKLDVLTPAGSTLTAINASANNGIGGDFRSFSTNTTIAALKGTNLGEGHGIDGLAISNNNTITAGVHGHNLGVGDGVLGTTSSFSASAAGSRGRNSGPGAGVIGENTSATSYSSAYGVLGRSSNPNSNAAGVAGINLGGGIGVLGTTFTGTAAILGVNQFTPSSPMAHGMYGITSNANVNASGVFGENKGLGMGVFGMNTNNAATGVAGVYGSVSGNSPSNSGVYGWVTGQGTGVKGECNGVGVSVFGLKSASANGGNAGRFEINNTLNTADGVFAMTVGNGAAVHAASGPSNTSALALMVDNGHIRSVAAAAPAAVHLTGLSTINMGMNYTVTANTDVKGSVICTFTNTGITIGAFETTNIAFTKPYATAPVAVISAEGNTYGLTISLFEVTNTYFRIRITNNTGAAITWPGTNFLKINYIVME